MERHFESSKLYAQNLKVPKLHKSSTNHRNRKEQLSNGFGHTTAIGEGQTEKVKSSKAQNSEVSCGI
jgi:hypothetical protein